MKATNGHIVDLPVERIPSFNISISRLEEMKHEYSLLKIDGIKDFEGQRKVTSARRTAKDMRIKVAKRKIELNKDLLKEQRLNNTAAKYLISQLFSIEDPLKLEEKRIKLLKEEARQEKLRKKLEKLQQRIDALAPFGMVPEVSELSKMNDKEFEKFFKITQSAYEEAERKKKEQADSLVNKLNNLEHENAELKKYITPAPAMAITDDPQEIYPLGSNTLPESEDEPVDNTADKDALQKYIDGIKAIELPKINSEVIRNHFTQGHTWIQSGLRVMQDAIKQN